MQRDDLVYVGHMVDCAEKAVGKVSGLTRADFDRDENLRLALTHLLQIVGEAARRVSAEFRTDHPEVPWKSIVGMRHKVVHDDFGVDEDVVWRTATVELSPLVMQLRKILACSSG